MNANSTNLSVVIPVYNSFQTLEMMYNQIDALCRKHQWNYEIIFVDDYSNKETLNVLQNLNFSHPDNIRVIRFAKNFGQNSATLCGIAYAKGDYIVTIDDDLDYPVEQIYFLYQKILESKSDLVYGVIPSRNIIKKLGKSIVGFFLSKIDGQFSSIGSSFRLMTKDLADKIAIHSRDHVFVNQVAAWYTHDVSSITIQRNVAGVTRSGYSLFRLCKIGIRLIVFYSSVPLKITMFLSFLISLISFFIGAYYLYIKLRVGAPLGYTSTIVSILFGTGVTLFGVGVMAAYINRIYDMRIKKPTYSIKNDV